MVPDFGKKSKFLWRQGDGVGGVRGGRGRAAVFSSMAPTCWPLMAMAWPEAVVVCWTTLPNGSPAPVSSHVTLQPK